MDLGLSGRTALVLGASRGIGRGIAEALGRVLVLDGGIGMRSEAIDGVYTGKPGGPFTYREGKADAIRELARAEGFDLSECYAYSDSESDLPMLRAVGHPVAVNPDSELERVARTEGWRIMRFEKLGRRLKMAVGAAGVVLAGWGGGYAAGRLRDRGKSRFR